MNRLVFKKTDNTLQSDSLYSIKTTSSEWQSIRSSALIGRLEATYRLKDFRIGVALSVPFTNFLLTPNLASQPINGLLFIRWQMK
jgi:hypothetical protein